MGSNVLMSEDHPHYGLFSQGVVDHCRDVVNRPYSHGSLWLPATLTKENSKFYYKNQGFAQFRELIGSTGPARHDQAQPGEPLQPQIKPILSASNRHFLNQNGTRGFAAPGCLIGTDLHDLLEHVLQIARNRDLLNRILDLTVLHPVAECAT